MKCLLLLLCFMHILALQCSTADYNRRRNQGKQFVDIGFIMDQIREKEQARKREVFEAKRERLLHREEHFSVYSKT